MEFRVRSQPTASNRYRLTLAGVPTEKNPEAVDDQMSIEVNPSSISPTAMRGVIRTSNVTGLPVNSKVKVEISGSSVTVRLDS